MTEISRPEMEAPLKAFNAASLANNPDEMERITKTPAYHRALLELAAVEMAESQELVKNLGTVTLLMFVDKQVVKSNAEIQMAIFRKVDRQNETFETALKSQLDRMTQQISGATKQIAALERKLQMLETEMDQ